MFWKGKRVLVTGHTGFKGSWLALWLQQVGAEVCGYALDPPTNPNLFEAASVGRGMKSAIGDIRDLARLQQEVKAFRPEIVFHLAAQPLVRQSYEDPAGTFETNVTGTANVLEAVRGCESVRAVVVITSDKCYENKEWTWAYRENDRLGGYDPYSSSKACAELVVASYRSAFFSAQRYQQHGVALASARAGNVIGGGDWGQDRLVPDIMRAFTAGQVLKIRNPKAVRPWQHVMEPLRGYLLLAERLHREGARFAEAWNFGPEYSDTKTVEWIVEKLAKAWGPEARWEVDGAEHPHEARTLKLDWTKASEGLGWRPELRLEAALQLTSQWYRAFQDKEEMRALTCRQIEQYRALVGEGPSGESEQK